MWIKIPCSIYRGGTSRAIFFRKEDLPSNPTVRDRVLLYIAGGNDETRINGLAGQTIGSSKVLLVNKSEREGTHIDYIHGQIKLDDAHIDYSMNGANIAFAVGLFSAYNELFEFSNKNSVVKTFNQNTQTYVDMALPLPESLHEGEDVYDYLSEEEPIELRFLKPEGEITGTLFPTGDFQNTLKVNGQNIQVTVIDSGNLSVLIDGQKLGMTGEEIQQSDIDPYMDDLTQIRFQVIDLLNHVSTTSNMKFEKSGLPKIVMIGSPVPYVSSTSETISSDQFHLWSRDITFNKLHPSYPASGAITIAVASLIPDTLAHSLIQQEKPKNNVLIGHPAGIMATKATVNQINNRWHAESASLFNTARLIMSGEALVPKHLLEQQNEEGTY